MVYSYSYRRQIPGFPSLAVQQHEILSFAMGQGMKIDKEVVEYATKNLPMEERKEFEDFLRSMVNGNTVIVSSLSVLSDKADELIKVINCMLTHDVDLWIASENMLISRDTSMVTIFPLLNTLREESKEKSTQIGRPKGSKSNSKFDIYHAEVVAFLAEGMSVSAIARKLEVSRSSLKDYIESRNIKDLVEGIGANVPKDDTARGMDNIVLICPFEEENKLNEKRAS
ncbi:MAG: recombinase family protein [Campylobacterota bacterium]|nr:recombinase family protein [Campylobacterota bacterium]